MSDPFLISIMAGVIAYLAYWVFALNKALRSLGEDVLTPMAEAIDNFEDRISKLEKLADRKPTDRVPL